MKEPSRTRQASASAAKGKGPGSSKATAPRRAPSQPVKVPPISSAPVAGSEAPAPGVKTVAGADNSVQEYGVEAGEAARREAAIALQAYLDARLREDWASACAALAQKPLQQLQRVERSAAKQGKELDGCPATMALLSEGIPRSQRLEEATVTEVLSFRGGGDIPGGPLLPDLHRPARQDPLQHADVFARRRLEGGPGAAGRTAGRVSLLTTQNHRPERHADEQP